MAGTLAPPGAYCKAESKRKVNGQTQSDFSMCVVAQAALRSGKTDSPREACKGAGARHVKGETGTALSRCVAAAAKLRNDRHRA